jgi:HlyD family secretion protein
VSVGSVVHRGSVIARIDATDLQAQRDEAAAQRREADERLAELLNGSRATDIAKADAERAAAVATERQAVRGSAPRSAAATAAVRDAEAAAALARATYTRTRDLQSTGDASLQSLDDARAALAQADARVAQSRADLSNLVQAELPGQRASTSAEAAAQAAAAATVTAGPRAEQIAQARANVAALRAAERYEQARLDETKILAPGDGVVESFDLHPGDVLAANQPAAIVDTFEDPYVYVYVAQRDLPSFAAGRALHVASDAGGAAYDAVVEARDRTPQFTPQNTETADDRAALVYGVKLRIHDPHHALLSGTTVTVSSP